MYRIKLWKEWSNGHLASYRWYLDCPANNTPKLTRGLREKFKDVHLDKPISTNSSFRGGKKNHSVKKLKKTKDQYVGRLNEIWDEEDLEE
jgi:hypothetical protein